MNKKLKTGLKLFKEWAYPIIVPLLITLITINFITPNPPVLDVVAREYYDVPSSTDVALEYLIKNPNSYKITVYTPIGYKFTWSDRNPDGKQFVPIANPTLITIGSSDKTEQQGSKLILNPAGNEGDSKLMNLKFKTPPKTENIQVLSIILDTDRGKITKEIRLNVVSMGE